MNIFAILFGAMAVKKMDYPSEIRDLKAKLPESERAEFLQHYKKLPNQAKTDFKTALRNADVTAASKILGEDLTKYNLALKPANGKAIEAKVDNPETLSGESDIIARVNKILAVPTGIDPELVAEAARRYEEAVPSGSTMAITEKTQRIIDLSS
jgi:hypothetical protein